MILGVGWGKHKIRPEHLVVLEIKEMLKKKFEGLLKGFRSQLKGAPQWPMLGQFEQQNENDNIGF